MRALHFSRIATAGVCSRPDVSRRLLMMGVALVLCACAGTPPNERETGSGGQLIRYSSRQVTVDLTDAQRDTLKSLRDRRYVASMGQTLDAVAATLTRQGFAPVFVDRETGIVEADRYKVLVPQWRQILRGVLKSRIGGLPAKADHERVTAIVAVRVSGREQAGAEAGAGLLVRVRFDQTVWDSNGDARTETLLTRDVYDGFFADVDASLKSPKPVDAKAAPGS